MRQMRLTRPSQVALEGMLGIYEQRQGYITLQIGEGFVERILSTHKFRPDYTGLSPD